MITREKNLNDFIHSLSEKNIGTYYSAFSKEAIKFGSRPLFTSVPDPIAVPYHWSYGDCMESLGSLTDYLSVEEAERRAVHLMNPGLKDIPGGNASILPTLYGGFQMIKPGDVAPSHRHSPANFRFIMQAPEHGSFTVINGYRIEMHPGDLTAQIPWVWHEHHNEGNSDLVWFAGLDAPLTSYISAMFYQHPEEVPGNNSGNVRGTGMDATSIYGNGLRPDIPAESKLEDFESTHNPLPYYPYSKTDSVLDVLVSRNSGEPATVEYTNPTTGEPLFKSMSAGMTRMPRSTGVGPSRSVENAVFVSFGGDIKASIEGIDHEINMSRGDVIAVPPWKKHSFVNTGKEEANLFFYSDRPVFQYLGLYRKENL